MTRKQPMLSTYKTQISRSVHIPGDPRLDCVIYTNENSYSKCINNELKDIFMNKIGCMPPLLGNYSKLICNTKLNISKQRYWDITILFWSLYYHDREYECRKPCTKSTYIYLWPQNPKSEHVPQLGLWWHNRCCEHFPQHWWANIVDQTRRLGEQWKNSSLDPWHYLCCLPGIKKILYKKKTFSRWSERSEWRASVRFVSSSK